MADAYAISLNCDVILCKIRVIWVGQAEFDPSMNVDLTDLDLKARTVGTQKGAKTRRGFQRYRLPLKWRHERCGQCAPLRAHVTTPLKTTHSRANDHNSAIFSSEQFYSAVKMSRMHTPCPVFPRSGAIASEQQVDFLCQQFQLRRITVNRSTWVLCCLELDQNRMAI